MPKGSLVEDSRSPLGGWGGFYYWVFFNIFRDYQTGKPANNRPASPRNNVKIVPRSIYTQSKIRRLEAILFEASVFEASHVEACVFEGGLLEAGLFQEGFIESSKIQTPL